MAEKEFGLEESFNIDDGQLEGMTPQEIFVLGYELGAISLEAEHNHENFHRLAHIDNQGRIEKALTKRDRQFDVKFSHDDQSERWFEVYVKPKFLMS